LIRNAAGELPRVGLGDALAVCVAIRLDLVLSARPGRDHRDAR
jgi:hypothetical protein